MRRPLISVTLIASSLAIGFAAGEFLSRRVWRIPDKFLAPPVPLLKEVETAKEGAGTGLSEMDTAAFSALQSALRNPAAGAGGMARNLHDLTARIVAGLRSAADCARAASLIDDLPTALRHTLTAIIFRRWAALDPAAALAGADGLKNWQSQRQAADLVLKLWTARDAAAALQAVMSSAPGYVRNSGMQAILSALSKDGPGSALQLLSRLPKPPPAALNQVLSAWTKDQPQEAWAWANAQGDPARREQSQRAVLGAMASSGQQQSALTLARQQPEGRVRRQMVSEVMQSWIRKDPENATSSAAKLPADEFTPEAAHSMVRSAFNILNGYAAGAPDPKAWAETQINQFAAGPHQEAVRAAMAVYVLTFNLGREFKADAALPLLSDMQDGPWKVRATAELAAAWTHTDAVAASEWLASLPKSPVRDQAVTKFVERIALSDPERARQWAATVQPP
jgi:hypothetical protein